VFTPRRSRISCPISARAPTYLNLTSDSARDVHYIDKDGKEIPPEQALKLAAKPMDPAIRNESKSPFKGKVRGSLA
jgi:hypothetical protein